MILPGEIYWADLPAAGRRPIVIVSREELNRGDVVSAVMITTAKFAQRSRLPNCVPLAAGAFGLSRPSVVQCETIGGVPVFVIELAAGPIGVLDDLTMRDVVRAIGYVIESDCEPI